MKETERHSYTIITEPTPAFKKNNEENKWNTLRDIFGGADGKTLKLDDYGQIDELQLIIPEGTVIEIIETCRASVIRILIEGLDGEYFIDERFLQNKTLTEKKPPTREAILPKQEKIIENLKAAVGTPYLWGGNKRDGIPRLLELYPPKGEISEKVKQQWMLAGVDCSGLLYEATNGCTPRNSSSLCVFGKPVRDLTELSPEEITKKLKPLDIIVWRGHVMIVLDQDHCIESRLRFYANNLEKIVVEPSFVKINSTKDALEETMQKRKLVEELKNPKEEFVIRRWYKGSKNNSTSKNYLQSR